MAVFNLLNLSLFFILVSNSLSGIFSETPEKLASFPLPCTRIECPSFGVVDSGEGYEIRRYNSTVWMTTSPIQDISLVEATRTGFLQLFDYIQGKNEYEEKIEMTAPVISKVLPSDGPFCESSFEVSFYVPEKNQANPPPQQNLHAQRWPSTYVAVRQFTGFVSDSNVGAEAAALESTLAGTDWYNDIVKSRGTDHSSTYIVAQYNSPFEFNDRVNEIWFLFDIKEKDQA